MASLFEAEVLFRNTTTVPSRAVEALEALGLSLEVIPTEDPGENTAFGLIRGQTELSEDDTGAWLLKEVLNPFDGDLIEWGCVSMTSADHPARVHDDEDMYIVVSDIDGVSDLFFDRDRADQYAAVADGTVFKLVRVEEGDAK